VGENAIMSNQTPEINIVRPVDSDWPEILAVLSLVNFDDIGGPEMEKFPIEDCFVAKVDGRVRGVGGYRILGNGQAKTTLLAVDPSATEFRLGDKLQTTRLEFLREQGVKTVFTNSDDPRVIKWLEKKYGFVRTGDTVRKLTSFGRADVDYWTTMRLDFD
jgi:N-acetylglutamate synthase-like GNAT family acetyltransferase